MKPIDPKRVKGVASLLESTDGLAKMPTLTEFLSASTLDTAAGTVPREPWSLFIMPSDGKLMVIVKEPSQRMRLRLLVASPMALWATLEAALSDPASLWEVDPWAREKPKGKRR